MMVVPQDPDADIDDVLKQSEALLDRLQANESERDFDGAASLTSLPSLGSLFNGSVRDLTTPTSVVASKKSLRVKIPSGSSQAAHPLLLSPLMSPTTEARPSISGLLAQVPDLETVPTMPTVNTTSLETIPTMPTVNTTSRELIPPPSPGRPPNWEKVLSAAQGDDDYVPIVDYSKLKPSNSQAPQQVVSSKVSRLEAYRKKAQRRRRRRRGIGFGVAIVLAMIYWRYWKSTVSEDTAGNLESETHQATGVDEEITVQPLLVEESLVQPGGEKQAEMEEESAPKDCIPEVDEQWASRCDDGEIEDKETRDDVFAEERSSPEDRGELPLGATEFIDEHFIEETRRSLSPPIVEGREIDYCKHPLARILSKKCQKIPQGPRVGLSSLIEKPVKAMVENPVFLVV